MRKTIQKTLILFSAILFVAIFPLLGVYTTNTTTYASDDREVILGGYPIGIIADGNGLLVTELINVTTQSGSFSPALKAGMKKGDIILSVNEENVTQINRLNELVQQGSPLQMQIKRDGNESSITIEPTYDLVTNSYKLGVMVKNNVIGIGTMTFITKEGAFGALGHRITDSFGNDSLYQKGKIFPCMITGYKKAAQDTPGELIGKIEPDPDGIGTIEKNVYCGIYGKLFNTETFSPQTIIPVGTKEEVKSGKAQILTTIEGDIPKTYSIEIVKAFSQNKPSEKGMVIRVTDRELLSTTGGILQGMSGSPILQNGKLIGAVTHVFTNDSTMGYGIYVDWMMKEA